MKKLQAYVLTGTAKAFIPAFVALALLMVVGFCMQLLHEGLDVVRLGPLVPRLLAYCVPVVLPSAFLTAVIMTFGRLSADNELMAVRAAGIHLFSMVYPVLVAALALCLVAGYFQFEMVPRARAAIKALKYTALKQILLNRAALSWKRQFSFPPAYIRYDDFEDGQMKGVVVLEIPDQLPRAIITAATSTIRPDPEDEEIIVFEMNDCVITWFKLEDYGEPGTITAERYIYSVRVAPRPETILTHRKHLPLGALLGRLAQLRREVATQPRLDDPEGVRRRQTAEKQRLDVSLGELGRILDSSTRKHARYAVEEPRRQQETIKRNEKVVADAEQHLKDLQEQQADCGRQLNEMRDGQTDLERQIELQKLQRTLLAQMDATKKEIHELRDEIAEANKLIKAARTRAAELEEQVVELQQRKAVLMSDRRELSRTIAWANDQYDLEAISLRIHKRLAQAVSVFVFALVGIPLGIAASRRSVMIAFGISFAIVLLIFYPFLILGQIVAEAGVVPMGLAMWSGNAFTFVIGAVLMVRVLRR